MKLISGVSCGLSCAVLAALGLGQARDASRPATISGTVRVLFQDRSYPPKNVPIYLFTLEQSKTLRRLQKESYERTSKPGMSEQEAILVSTPYWNAALDLVPGLSWTARTKTDVKGCFLFKNVDAGRPYQVVALAPLEDGDLFVVRLTPVLKPGERFHVEMREDEPWNTPDRWQVTPDPSKAGEQEASTWHGEKSLRHNTDH